MPERIELEPHAIAGLIGTARLNALRAETPPAERERAVATAVTALDALCGLVDRGASGDVWDVFSLLDSRALITFATFAVTELSDTDYSVAWREARAGDASD